MKTLLFTLEFPPFKGGVANYYGNLANYWPVEEDLLILNNNEGKLRRGYGFWSWRYAYGALKRKIAKNKINYILVGQILPLGTVVLFLSLFKPLKYAVFLHGMDWTYALKIRRKRYLTELILKRADKIICANSYVATQVADFYPMEKDKIGLVNPGVASNIPHIASQDLQKLEDTYHLQNKIVLLSLGRLVQRKGIDQVIKVLATISEPLLDNLIYFIAGSGPAEAYLHRLIPSTLKNKIIFLGSLTEQEKWLWLKKTDIFLMPAREIDGDFEGFGIVYLEANLCGRPVIAGNSGGVPDAVLDNYNGLLVNPRELKSIKQAIIKLATDENLRHKLGEQGRARAIKEFNWKKQVAQLLKLIKN